MIIETQNTPDANVVNFFPSEKILKSGSAEFADAKSLRKSPLAEKFLISAASCPSSLRRT